MRAEKAVEKISRSYLKYVRDMNIKKNEYERNYMVFTARNEERNNVKVEIAQKMKTAGKPMSEIEEFTGLSSQAIDDL